MMTPSPRRRALRSHGRKSKWLAHHRLGYNYRLSELAAALGVAQAQRLDEILEDRRRVAREYMERLMTNRYLILPTLYEETHVSWFVFVVRLNDLFEPGDRDEVMEELRAERNRVRGYFADHLHPLLPSSATSGHFPVRTSRRTLGLPFFSKMTKSQAAGVWCWTRAGEDADEPQRRDRPVDGSATRVGPQRGDAKASRRSSSERHREGGNDNCPLQANQRFWLSLPRRCRRPVGRSDPTSSSRGRRPTRSVALIHQTGPRTFGEIEWKLQSRTVSVRGAPRSSGGPAARPSSDYGAAAKSSYSRLGVRCRGGGEQLIDAIPLRHAVRLTAHLRSCSAVGAWWSYEQLWKTSAARC
jgi:hypothetical protein